MHNETSAVDSLRRAVVAAHGHFWKLHDVSTTGLPDCVWVFYMFTVFVEVKFNRLVTLDITKLIRPKQQLTLKRMARGNAYVRVVSYHVRSGMWHVYGADDFTSPRGLYSSSRALVSALSEEFYELAS